MYFFEYFKNIRFVSRCGLVALAMASTLTNNQPVITEDIFKEAQTRGYSKQGEMFMGNV